MDQPLRDNQALWDAWTRIHVPSAFYDVASFLDGSRPIRLADYERAEVGPVAGRTLLHLQCHFGLDTLSWARLGARVTGIDFSAEAIAAARTLAADVGLEARFVQANVYDAPDAVREAFDIVYTSRGVLGWLPDIEGWARVVASLVKPGGTFYVTEIHPVAQVFADEDVAPGELRLAYPYWSHRDPITFDVHGSYADPTAPTEGLVEHGWSHSLGEIISALIDAGLLLDFVHEHPFVEWPVAFLADAGDGRYRLPPDARGELPLFFSLRATKPGFDAAAGRADAAGAVRRRAADELHDVAGQSLVAAYRLLEAARARDDEPGTRADLEAAGEQLLAGMRELRAIGDGLVAPGLEELGLAAAVRGWAERRTRTGRPVEVDGDLSRDAVTLEAASFDLVTEAATALDRSAPGAAVAIDLRAPGDRRIITLTGEGGSALADPRNEDGRRALASIQRLAARLGGTARIASVGSGAGLVLELPSVPADGAGDDGGDRR